MFGVKDTMLEEAKKLFGDGNKSNKSSSNEYLSNDPKSLAKQTDLARKLREEPFRYEKLSWKACFPKLVDTSVQKLMKKRGISFAVNSIYKCLYWDKTDGKLIGVIAFGSDCEGPPGAVHGGAIATALDEVFAWGGIRHFGFSGVTLSLNINYHKFIPLRKSMVGVEIEIEKVEGRKVFMKGKVFNLDNSDIVHNTATALFYKANPLMPSFEEAIKVFGANSNATKEQVLQLFAKPSSSKGNNSTNGTSSSGEDVEPYSSFKTSKL
ncbi:hypothetical protein ABK040_010485 [Willaertia magna]